MYILPLLPVKEDTVSKNHEYIQKSDSKGISPQSYCWRKHERPNPHSPSTYCSCKQSCFIFELLCGNRWLPNVWLPTTAYGETTTDLLNEMKKTQICASSLCLAGLLFLKFISFFSFWLFFFSWLNNSHYTGKKPIRDITATAKSGARKLSCNKNTVTEASWLPIN